MYGRKGRPHPSVVVEQNVTQTFPAVQKKQCTSFKPRPVTVIHSNVTNAATRVMDAMHAPVYFETYGKYESFAVEVVDSIRNNKVCLNRRLKTSLCAAARKQLNLFASMVKCFSLNGHDENVDIVMIKENTGGQYGGCDHEVIPGVIQSFQVTMKNLWSDRIAKYVFEFAQLNKRKKVIAVHNKRTYEKFMKLADAFFLDSCQEAAKMYPASLKTKYLLITVVCDL
ncbi:unnamed protein product [Eruca vesicaria subsp. sativa]|uniref:Isopropylmalate dehydrogenase-like domain-containing protein n=1 Tax=Eruca vesicaria subsp. sativa TaxID=29727 RepID=A0ABC8L185_ERUVS|nr:unnamed protein product [Eruca vesicaria subsp. sativa]